MFRRPIRSDRASGSKKSAQPFVVCDASCLWRRRGGAVLRDRGLCELRCPGRHYRHVQRHQREWLPREHRHWPSGAAQHLSATQACLLSHPPRVRLLQRPPRTM